MKKDIPPASVWWSWRWRKWTVETYKCEKVCNIYILMVVVGMSCSPNQSIIQWVNRNEGVNPQEGAQLTCLVSTVRPSVSLPASCLHCLHYCRFHCSLYIFLQILNDSYSTCVHDQQQGGSYKRWCSTVACRPSRLSHIYLPQQMESFPPERISLCTNGPVTSGWRSFWLSVPLHTSMVDTLLFRNVKGPQNNKLLSNQSLSRTPVNHHTAADCRVGIKAKSQKDEEKRSTFFEGEDEVLSTLRHLLLIMLLLQLVYIWILP